MVTRAELTQVITHQIHSKTASTFFLNGAPGAGKSHFLRTLADRLPEEFGPRLNILGPYLLVEGSSQELAGLIARDLEPAGYLDQLFPSSTLVDVSTLWQWFAAHAHLPKEQAFVILIDFAVPQQVTLPVLSSLFSSARALEGMWEHRSRVHHIFAGFWNQLELRKYYSNIRTSFPYTRGNNYRPWEGLDVDDLQALLLARYSEVVFPVHGHLLHELCGGHPAVALEIINAVPAGQLRSLNLLTAARQVAANGLAAQALLSAWSRLPADLLAVVKLLMVHRYVRHRLSTEEVEVLQTVGLTRLSRLGQMGYLSFRSWYVELVVRLHAVELGIADARLQRLRIDDLMPDVYAINAESYQLINHIENAARNFVSLYLYSHQTGDSPILANRAKKYNQDTCRFEDALQRAEEWKQRSAVNGLPADANPLMAFLSTRDLAQLITEIAHESKIQAWAGISQALLDLADIRDAVMHNQLIDDGQLNKLYDLQASFYQALNASGS